MEFGDVIIIIYPLPNGLFKIKIDRKPDVSMRNGALSLILSSMVLLGNVR